MLGAWLQLIVTIQSIILDLSTKILQNTQYSEKVGGFSAYIYTSALFT